MSAVYCGVDPGKSGGIAWITGDSVTALKMPDTERDIFVIFKAISEMQGEKFCLIERVHAMPGQGVTSMFNFGMGYGALRMAVLASGIPFEGVTPQAWMKGLGCLTGGDKQVSKERAQNLFPKIKVTNYVADALLLAEFCKRSRTGNLKQP